MKKSHTRSFSLSPEVMQKIEELQKLVKVVNGFNLSASAVVEFAILKLHENLLPVDPEGKLDAAGLARSEDSAKPS